MTLHLAVAASSARSPDNFKLARYLFATKGKALMRLMGHFRPNWAVRTTSGFPPVATGQQTSRIGSFVPNPDITDATNSKIYTPPIEVAQSTEGWSAPRCAVPMRPSFATELVPLV